MKPLSELLAASAAYHSHLCPRQVLGVRMGMLAGELLALDLPQDDKRLLSIVETDGCLVDGISVATNCWVGRRTMRIEDFGKVAVTFVDTETGQAFRVTARSDVRQSAPELAPEARTPWEAMLLGYQRMPADELLAVQAVQLNTSVAQIISRPGIKVTCEECGEQVINERHVYDDGRALCRPCAGQGAYSALQQATVPAVEAVTELLAMR